MLTFLLHKTIHSGSQLRQLFILRLQPFSSSSSILSIPKFGTEESFTLHYLLNKCGISHKKTVNGLKVVSFFKNQGFTDTQILELVQKEPRVVNCNVEDTLLPKIQFFRSKGASTQYLAKIVIRQPRTIWISLKNSIVPSFNFIKDYLGSDEKAIYVLQVRPRILHDIHSHVKPNIEMLYGAGMPHSKIALLLKLRPHLFLYSTDKLKGYVEEVQKMGIDPSIYTFGKAVNVLALVSGSNWSKKMEFYKRWGCSEDEVLTTFKKLPEIMMISEEKIDGVMSFFVSEIGWESSKVMKRYFMFTLSLNKRIIPRWSVFRELLSKGLVKREDNVSKMFMMKEDVFLEKYVNHHKDEAPLLLKLYLEKLEASK